MHERLTAGDSLRTADFGCGEGWAAIYLAEAYPNITVYGFDLDDASIAAARKHAAVGALAAMRRATGGRGAVLIIDEKAADTFEPSGDPVERLLYAFSITGREARLASRSGPAPIGHRSRGGDGGGGSRSRVGVRNAAESAA